MTITFEHIAWALGFLILAASFIIARFKEAEGKGRMAQKIETLEKDLSALGEKLSVYENKVNCHDGELVEVKSELKSLRETMERMDKKMDRILEMEYPK